MMTHELDDDDIERMTDIIGDGELTAEAQERLHREGLWPLYESLRQTAYAAFVFGPPKWVALAPQTADEVWTLVRRRSTASRNYAALQNNSAIRRIACRSSSRTTAGRLLRPPRPQRASQPAKLRLAGMSPSVLARRRYPGNCGTHLRG